MSMRLFLLALGFAVTAGAASAGQHEGHPGAAITVDAVQAAQCVQAQSVVTELAEAALKRLEAARLTNNAAAMRDAVDDLQATLLDIKQQLSPCGQLIASSDAAGHVGHVMPNMQQSPNAAPETPAVHNLTEEQIAEMVAMNPRPPAEIRQDMEAERFLSGEDPEPTTAPSPGHVH